MGDSDYYSIRLNKNLVYSKRKRKFEFIFVADITSDNKSIKLIRIMGIKINVTEAGTSTDNNFVLGGDVLLMATSSLKKSEIRNVNTNLNFSKDITLKVNAFGYSVKGLAIGDTVTLKNYQAVNIISDLPSDKDLFVLRAKFNRESAILKGTDAHSAIRNAILNNDYTVPNEKPDAFIGGDDDYVSVTIALITTISNIAIVYK